MVLLNVSRVIIPMSACKILLNFRFVKILLGWYTKRSCKYPEMMWLVCFGVPMITVLNEVVRMTEMRSNSILKYDINL